MSATEQTIRVGEKWEQKVRSSRGKVFERVVEIIAAPTLSSPVGYRILRNDQHPHRVGKTASIGRRAFWGKYWPVHA